MAVRNSDFRDFSCDFALWDFASASLAADQRVVKECGDLAFGGFPLLLGLSVAAKDFYLKDVIGTDRAMRSGISWLADLSMTMTNAEQSADGDVQAFESGALAASVGRAW